MKKNYILDTNVLLHDPNSLLKFDDNNVLLPIEVIEEIDTLDPKVAPFVARVRSLAIDLKVTEIQRFVKQYIEE